MPESSGFYDDHPLHALVIAELRDNDTTARKQLEKDTRGWISALTQIIESTDVQFGARRAAFEAVEIECRRTGDMVRLADARQEYDGWRGRNNGFKRRVVQRLRTVKALHKTNNVAQDNKHHRSRFFALKRIDEILEAPHYDDPTADLEAIAMVIDSLKEAGALD